MPAGARVPGFAVKAAESPGGKTVLGYGRTRDAAEVALAEAVDRESRAHARVMEGR